MGTRSGGYYVPGSLSRSPLEWYRPFAVDLNPPVFDYSIAYGVRNGKQVGAGIMENWRVARARVERYRRLRNRSSPLLPNSFGWSTAYDVAEHGHVFAGVNPLDLQYYAIEWVPGRPAVGRLQQRRRRLTRPTTSCGEDSRLHESAGQRSDRRHDRSAQYNTWRAHFRRPRRANH